MSGRLEMFRQPAARPVQADPERRRRAFEDARGLARREAVPGDQAQDLALVLVRRWKAREKRSRRWRASTGSGASAAGPASCLRRSPSRSRRWAERRWLATTRRAMPKSHGRGSSGIRSRRRQATAKVSDAASSAVGPVGQTADREGEDRRVVVAEAALESAVLVAGWGHLWVDVPHDDRCYSAAYSAGCSERAISIAVERSNSPSSRTITSPRWIRSALAARRARPMWKVWSAAGLKKKTCSPSIQIA